MADRQLGNVLDALNQHDFMLNTLIVFLGDNGFMMGGRDMPQFKRNKPFMGKVFPYEDSVRVPLTLAGPHFAGGGPSDAPVSSLDLPSTILRAAGVPVPPTWSGHDLGDDSKIDESFCEFADNESDKFGDIAYRLVRTRTHKLIVYQSKARADELYDIANDSRETKNLASDPAAKPVYEDLLSRLHAWMRRTDDPALKWRR